MALSSRNGVEGRSSGAAVPGVGGQTGKGGDGLARGDHRRRQCGHRFGADGAAHGRAGHHSLSPRAQGYAGHRRGDSGGRGGGRALCLSGRAASHCWRRGWKCEGHRDREDAAGRIRQIRPQKADSHRRGAALRVRQRDSGRGRDLRSGFLPRLRPGTERRGNDRRGSLLAGDQPPEFLCRRRRDHRRIECLQCHGRRQTGGAEDRRAPDGREPLGAALSRFRIQPPGAGRAKPQPPPRGARRGREDPRSLAAGGGCRPQIRKRRWRNAAAACAAI